jgi:hypothetical protein
VEGASRHILHRKERALKGSGPSLPNTKLAGFLVVVEDVDEIRVGEMGEKLDFLFKRFGRLRAEIQMKKLEGDRLIPVQILR